MNLNIVKFSEMTTDLSLASIVSLARNEYGGNGGNGSCEQAYGSHTTGDVVYYYYACTHSGSSSSCFTGMVAYCLYPDSSDGYYCGDSLNDYPYCN